MHYYRALVRLSGSLMNEVWKSRISAPEVILLNAIHGGSAVVDLQPAAVEPVVADFDPKQHRRLRARLEETYAKQQYHDLMNSLFGAAKGAMLPTEVTLADLKPVEDREFDFDEDEPELPVERKPAPQTSDDPKEALKASLRDLDWAVPVGNVSEKRLRDELALAQEAWAKKHNPDDAETHDVLAG
jgi:hypothetical protein